MPATDPSLAAQPATALSSSLRYPDSAPPPAATPPRPRARLAGVRATLQRKPLANDVVLVLLLIVPGGLRFLSGTLSYDWSPATQLPLLLPLLWRSRAPITVLLAVGVLAAAIWACGARPHVEVPLLVALHAVAAHHRPRRTLGVLALLHLAAAVSLGSFAPGGARPAAMVLCSGILVATAFAGSNVRLRRVYRDGLEKRAADLERERDQQTRIAVAAERTRLAREVHDVVAHNLSVMIALADGAVYARPVQREVIMKRVAETGRQALDDVRRLLGLLRDTEPRPDRATRPCFADLGRLLATVADAGLRTELIVTGTPFALHPAVQLAVYRVAQEALTNTLRHANASVVQMRLHFGPAQQIELRVTDDGRPGPAARPGPGGHGLVGMRERVAPFAGTLHAGPGPDGGWQVRAQLSGAAGNTVAG